MNERKRHAHRNLNATVAKMHAVYGKMLGSEDYSALMGCTNVSDAAGYLKRSTHFIRNLENVETDNIHRGNLENILRKSVIENYFRMIGFEHIEGDEFYNYMIIRTEINEILVCIQHLNAGTDDHINMLPIYMNKYTSFNLMELAQVRRYSELLSLISRTPYFPILYQFRPENMPDGSEGHIDYAGCELKLRTYYFNRILESLHSFGKDTESRLREYIGTQIDMINIINSYRMKKHFNADEAEIKKRMIPIYVKISEKKFDEMYGAADEKGFLDAFADTCYGREIAAKGYDMTHPETTLVQLRYKQTKRMFSRSQTAPECFFTFNTLAEIEVTNIIRVIEGVRYGLPSKEISSLLVT